MINLKYEITFRGPNPYSADPVIVASLNISPDNLVNANSLSQAMARACEPWVVYEASADVDPTVLSVAHFLATWSLAALNQFNGFVHAAGATRDAEQTLIWLGFHNPQVSYSALNVAAKLFAGIGTGNFDDEQIRHQMSSLCELCKKHHPHESTLVLMEAARERKLPFMSLLGDSRIWQFGWGRKSIFFNRTSPKEDSHHGTMLSRDKAFSKVIFARLGIPHAPHVLVTSQQQLEDAAAHIGWPCVVKPLDGAGGKGVMTDIRSQSDLSHAFALAKKTSNKAIMVESHVDGEDIRLFVVRGKLLAAIRREPPSIVGDGERSIGTLINQTNQIRSAHRPRIGFLYPIPIDQALGLLLAQRGLSLDDVLPIGQKLAVRGNANGATGGIVFDVSSSIHKDVGRMAEMLADAFGIAVAGIDYITTALDRSPVDGKGAVIEINSFPSLNTLIGAGLEPSLVGQIILGSEPDRIPVAMVLATPSSLSEFRKHLPRNDGNGWVCDGTAGVGTTELVLGDRPFFDTTRMLLQNPKARSLTVACGVDDVIRTGLPFDKIDRLILFDVEFEKEWTRVFHNHCDEMVRFEDIEAVCSNLNNWVGNRR